MDDIQQAEARRAELERLKADNPGMEDVETADVDGIHSSDFTMVPESPEHVEVIEHNEANPDHIWRRGVLPGGIYIKSCDYCHVFEKIEYSEWQGIAR